MQLTQLIETLERFAPLSLAEEWDNPGLLIEPEQSEIARVLVALDATPAVADEAARVGAQLLLTHHPLFFSAVKRLHTSEPDAATACRLIRAGVGLYAAHTNLDGAPGGVNDVLAGLLGLRDIRPLLRPDAPLSMETAGIGRVGNLPAPMPLAAFAKEAGRSLHAAPRFAGPQGHICRRVAVLGGSGGDFLRQARAAGADTLLTGEAKHHEALAAHAMGMALVEAGHYETERPVLEPWIEGLQKASGGLQYKVDFIVSEAGRAPFCTP